MAKLFKWTERAERKFNQTIMGVNPLCLLHHFIVLAVWERFNQSIQPESLSIDEVRAKLESIYKESDLDGATMADMFQEQDFSLNPEDFPGCQNDDSNNDTDSDDSEFELDGDYNRLKESGNNASRVEKAGPSGTNKRQVNKRRKNVPGKNKKTSSKTNKRRRRK